MGSTVLAVSVRPLQAQFRQQVWAAWTVRVSNHGPVGWVHPVFVYGMQKAPGR